MHAQSKGTSGHKTKVMGKKKKESHLLLKLVCPAKQEKKMRIP